MKDVTTIQVDKELRDMLKKMGKKGRYLQRYHKEINQKNRIHKFHGGAV